MNLTKYQYQILDLLDLRFAWDRKLAEFEAGKAEAHELAKIWDKAQRQLWATPQSFVDGLAAIADLQITVDLCAEAHTAKAPIWFGPGSPICEDSIGRFDDGLGGYGYRFWHHLVEVEDVLFCNPDFLRKSLWTKGMRRDEAIRGFLNVPPDTDQGWFGDLHEDPRCHLTVLEGRLRYEPPEGIKATSPNGGTVVWQVNFDAPVLPPRLDWREVCEIGKAVAA